MDFSRTSGIVSSKVYDKRVDFNFEIDNFQFLEGDIPRSHSYGGYTPPYSVCTSMFKSK